MSILVYAESWEGKFRKSTFEAVSYAKKLSQLLNTNVKSISIQLQFKLNSIPFNPVRFMPIHVHSIASSMSNLLISISNQNSDLNSN